MIKVGIIGASGYAGGELLRLLLFHPEVEVTYATSESMAGQPVYFAHPNLRSITDLKFISRKQVKDKVDCLFVSLPNGLSMQYMKDFMPLAKKIIDLGADFRLEREDDWRQWYKKDHSFPELMKNFVYGLPELNRERIKKADYIAGPGCEATVSILTLYPAVVEDLIESKPIIIDAKMSSSQAGKSYSLSSHHPERAGCVRSYMPSGHRHTAEIEMMLRRFDEDFLVDISATAIDMVRGILVTIHTFLKPGVEEKDVWKAYRKHYSSERFIRIIKQRTGIYRFPEPKLLVGTNYCDIGFEIDKRSRRLILIGAIDNLTRGTAGQAVQCMNLMFGFPEDLSLEFPGLHPI